jgi:ribosomal protein S18 acetylase RimI-like enzyme
MIQQIAVTNQSIPDYRIDAPPDAPPPVWAGSPIHRSLATPAAIRLGRPADAPLLARLGAAMFAKTHRRAIHDDDLADYLAQALTVQQVAAELADPTNTFLIAEISGVLGGFVKLSATPPPASVQTSSPIELSRLYLEPRLIGRGVGSRLMTNALAYAAHNHFATCWLCVWEGNARAIKFYQNWGFRPIGNGRLEVGRSFPVGLIMSRSV